MYLITWPSSKNYHCCLALAIQNVSDPSALYWLNIVNNFFHRIFGPDLCSFWNSLLTLRPDVWSVSAKAYYMISCWWILTFSQAILPNAAKRCCQHNHCRINAIFCQVTKIIRREDTIINTCRVFQFIFSYLAILKTNIVHCFVIKRQLWWLKMLEALLKCIVHLLLIVMCLIQFESWQF